MQVRVENLYYLLSYAWTRFHEVETVSVDVSDAPAIEELFARVLVSACQKLLRERLDRGYREESAELRRPRGRLNLGRTMARGLGKRGLVDCTFDDLTEDVPHNRVIKATVRQLANVSSLPATVRHPLLRIVRDMSGVADVVITGEHFQRLQLHSNLRRYRFAISVCGLAHRCLLPDAKAGAWTFRSFTGSRQEMGLLFEDFVRAFLAREQQLFDRVERTRMRWEVQGDGSRLFPMMHTDITLRAPGRTVIVETKCYPTPLVSGHHGTAAVLRGDDVSQLVSYVANLSRIERAEVSGVLLYAVDRHVLPYTRVRVLGHDVHVAELNLNQPWQEIGLELRRIVTKLHEPDPQREPVA